MTLGLGIFLSSLFLGIIYIFVSTKDRWNWKKILFVWPLCIVLVVGVIGGAGFYIYNHYENKHKTYNRYIDIPLNAPESDLFFLKGHEYLKKDYTRDKSFVFYQYEIKDKYQFNVILKDNKIWRISCYSDTSYDCPSLNKIQIHDSANKVKERLGEPNHVSSNDDNTQRIWAYEQFNIYMMLSKGKINGIGIFEPSLGIPSENDIQGDFYDYNKYDFIDKNLTIIGVPTEIFDPNRDNDKKAKLFFELIDTSSDGDKIVWSEFIALRERKIKEQDSLKDKYSK